VLQSFKVGAAMTTKIKNKFESSPYSALASVIMLLAAGLFVKIGAAIQLGAASH
jgi:hypothetical protein